MLAFIPRLTVWLALLFAVGYVHASWQYVSRTDSMTDETKQMALVLNDEGFSFGVYRIKSGAVWGQFSLPSKGPDQLDPRNPIMFRIDKNSPADFRGAASLERSVGLKTYTWEPRWSGFLLWHGDDKQGRAAKIRELMTGESLLVRYYVLGGTYKETVFTLKNAGPAIAEALAISETQDPVEVARIDAYNAVYKSAAGVCTEILKGGSAGSPAEAKACMARLTECGKQSNREAEALKACLPQ